MKLKHRLSTISLCKRGEATNGFVIVRQGPSMFAKSDKTVSAVKKIRKKKLDLSILEDSIPGLSRIFQKDTSLLYKFLWSSIILGNIMVCAYQIVSLLLFYLKYPIATDITLNVNHSFLMPSLTVCPMMHGFTLKQLCDDRCTEEQKNNTNFLKTFAYIMKFGFNVTDAWELLNGKNILGTVSFYQISSAFVPIKNFLSLPVENRETLTPLGTCTTLSFPKAVPYRNKDLFLYISINPKFQPKINKSILAYIYPHGDDEDVTYTYFHKMYEVKSNFLINYGLSSREYRLLNTAKNPCTSITYASACERRCFEDLLKPKINCSFYPVSPFLITSLPYMKYISLPLCKDGIQGYIVFQETLALGSVISYKENCSCPRRCSEVIYDVEFDDFREIPNFAGTGLIYFVKNNMVQILTEKYTYGIIIFLCDLGGNLGLYLGLCIPSIISIVEVLSAYFYNIFRKY